MNPSNTVSSTPEIPSTNMYYNSTNSPTTNTEYYSSSSIYLSSSQPSSDMSVVTAAAVAAAAAGLPNSLPPLSDLLPNTTSSKHPLEKPEPFISSHVALLPSQPQYRKSQDYSRMYPEPDPHRRSFVSSQQNGYYVYPSPAHSTFPTNTTPVVPSTDLSNYPPPTSSVYGRNSIYQNLPSPPTSVDGVLMANEQSLMHCHQSQKVFSFVSLPGMNQKKRPRRKFHEVERLYQCNYPSCSKAYGTLNHLNAHVSMQRHGPKRQPSEFKELRKMWRKQKRDSKQRSNSLESFQDTAPPPMDSDGPNDLLNQPHYMPPPCTLASFMPSQQSQQSESNFHAPHWINQRSVYPAASTHFMPLGY